MDVMENIFKHYSKKPVNIHRIFDLELCYLQIRKIFELMMFSGLLAQDTAQLRLSKKIHNSYKATEILTHVRKMNPAFFPKAVTYHPDSQTLEPRLQDLEKPHLREHEFAAIYKRKIDAWMHANKNYDKIDVDYEKEYTEIISIHGKVIYLLIHHSIQLPTGDLIIASNYDKHLKKPTASICFCLDDFPDGKIIFPD